MSTNVFEYSVEKLGTAQDLVQCSGTVSSVFDSSLCQLWEQRMKDRVFAFNLDEVKRKRLSGIFGIYLLLNEKRFSQRRKPAEATQVLMPFDKNKFNFNKVKDTEVIFDLKRTDDSESKDRIIVNVFPIEYGHVLLLPRYKDCLPQVLTQDAVELALHISLLSTHDGFLAGFNGLCALASVNHLHIQTMYLKHSLPIASADVELLSGKVFTLHDYFVNGFALQLTDVGCLGEISSDVMRITSHLCGQNIPLNMVICKRKLLMDKDSPVEIPVNGKSYVTVFIFPKVRSPEEPDDPFNCAFLEIAGLIPMKDSSEFEGTCEEDVLGVLAKYTYASPQFDMLKQQIIHSLHT